MLLLIGRMFILTVGNTTYNYQHVLLTNHSFIHYKQLKYFLFKCVCMTQFHLSRAVLIQSYLGNKLYEESGYGNFALLIWVNGKNKITIIVNRFFRKNVQSAFYDIACLVGI